jgi:DNA-binding PadR family transcriptional regulator
MERQRSRPGFGRHEMSRGRGRRHGRHRVRRGDVRSAVLALLDDRPMHGYEMIQELEERTGGRWTPSPGSIYPTLQLLEDEGLVSAEEVEGRKVYSLTEAGQKEAPARTEEARPWEEGDEDSPRFAVRQELFRTIGAAKTVARGDDDAQMEKAAEILKDARRKLYGLLAEE